jgi:hypothetical protein
VSFARSPSPSTSSVLALPLSIASVTSASVFSSSSTPFHLPAPLHPRTKDAKLYNGNRIHLLRDYIKIGLPEQQARAAVDPEFCNARIPSIEACMEISLQPLHTLPSTIPPVSPFYVSPQPSLHHSPDGIGNT